MVLVASAVSGAVVPRLSSLVSSLAIALTCLAGCSVGPNYHAPVPLIGTQGAFASLSQASQLLPAPPAPPAPVTTGDVPTHWWRLYQDPVLDALVRDALTQNRDLAVAAARVQQARAVFDETGAMRLPQTDASFGVQYGKPAADQTVAASRGTHANTRWAWAPSFALSWEVDLWGRVGHAIDAAEAEADASLADAQAMQVVVAAQTVAAYAQACGFAQQRDVAQRTLDIATHIADLTRTQQVRGLVSTLEVIRAQAFVDDTRASLPVLEGNRRAALYELAVLTGRPPAALPAPAEQCQRVPALAQPFPVGDGASLLQRRPDLRAMERRLAAATARVGVATADLYPGISLGGGVEWLSTSGSLASLGNRYSVSWGVGPLIRWQIPNMTASRARLAAARADDIASLAAFDARVLVALKETEQALTHYGAQWARRDALRASRAQHAQALMLAERSYRAGAIDFLELLDAQRSLAVADAALAQSTLRVADDQVAVFRALGGGWQPDAEALPQPVPHKTAAR
ncbi:RND transporter [Pandoraea iniqua]|uniref:RND transporter n=1 Tax=Pandoraea iniqua TaxID=2508288 RepID=A0A5E4VJL5_9BURK|nr:TolC family protein [Pandoraea iniqua]VVE12401.1 RND transporter [Pandoraea iniqua]